MSESPGWRISLKQAIYFALTVLAVYYPITIYVNVPASHIIKASSFLIFPAIINFIFYVLLIITTDRLIDWIEKKVNRKFLMEFSFSTVMLCIPFAIVATVFSYFFFNASFKATSMLRHLREERHEGPPDPPLSNQQWDNLRRTNNGLTLIIVLSIFYLLINRKANIRMKEMEVQAEQLTKENALAQYEALKNQVSPHFLFNSLSILSSLVHADPDLSEKFIDQLSKAYRYILEQKDNDTILLKTELDFINSYAFLLKIRFENKFDVNISVSNDHAEKYRIAPLTLQMLIENCVKHNRMSQGEPLRVDITIRENYLVVSNAVKPRSEHERMVSTGIGLANIKNRYKLLTDLPVQVESGNETFTVKIPLL